MSNQKKTREQLKLLRDEALEAYLNREDFRYDLNGDALYRQYKDRYMELGKTAMQDTMGQAAALTGGYGSSYAQNVGQQAYNSYLQQLGDVVPELYQLAYDRYRNKGDALYKNYQTWAQLEQEAADREQWELEYALAERKRQDALAKAQQDQDGKDKDDKDPDAQLPDYYAWLSVYQGKGQRAHYNDPTQITKYDNQNVSTGNIMTLQRVLGMPETGMWTLEDTARADGLEADAAWLAYTQGKLQNRNSFGMGDMGLANEKVVLMERALGLREDGYWSEEDKKAAGGLSEANAWEAYQRGYLQNWR